VVFLSLCWSSELPTPLGAPHQDDCLVLLAAVVLPAQGLHAMTKLLELLVTRARSDPLVAVLCTAMCTMILYPSDF
jgi:hypothetical protein